MRSRRLPIPRLQWPPIAEQYLLSAANQERAARGLSELHRDVKLAHAAANHAQKMAEHGSISHQFPGEAELTDRGAGAGVAFSVISENVAQAPSVLQIHDMWMHSEHHRANLLDPAVDAVGISVIARGGELYAVEDFARTVRAVSLEAQESAIAGLVSQAGSDLARLECGEHLGRAPDLRDGDRLRGRAQALVRDAIHLGQPDPIARPTEDAGRFGQVSAGDGWRVRREAKAIYCV